MGEFWDWSWVFILVALAIIGWVFRVWSSAKEKAEMEKRRRQYLEGTRCRHCDSTDIEDIEGEELDLLLKMVSYTKSSSDSNARYSLSFPRRCKRCGNVFWT